MDSVSTRTRLRRLADHARARGDHAFAVGLERYIAKAPEGMTLDQALNLAGGRGGERWWSVEHRQHRDAAICEFDRRYCPGETHARRRAVLQAELRRYQRQQRDKRLPATPPTGTPAALLFEIFRSHESLDSRGYQNVA